MYARMTPLRLKSKVSHTSWLKTDMRRQEETERERVFSFNASIVAFLHNTHNSRHFDNLLPRFNTLI